jgi:predicted membrane protein
MIALAVTGATLLLVGAIVISLERHRRLTPITALITGLGTVAIVFGSIMATIVTTVPATAGDLQRGLVGVPLVERVVDVTLPTL